MNPTTRFGICKVEFIESYVGFILYQICLYFNN